MSRKGGGREGSANHQPEQDLLRAYQEIAALPEDRRKRMMELVRRASDLPLDDGAVERIAAILWADRGEGLVESLEAGFKLFEAPKETEKPRRRRRRAVSSFNADERQHLLASLLANRHTPPASPVHED